ncbi:MAG: phytanoyl-CoA dioxygenase family protein, partial [Woeseiaceae bacterium]
MQDSHAYRVAQVLEFLQANYHRPLDIATIARAVNMSSSALHHIFKEITASSPLQYPKKLRLHLARLLMLHDRLGAGEAVHRRGASTARGISGNGKAVYKSQVDVNRSTPQGGPMPETAPQTLFSTTRNTPELTADDVAHYRENGYLVVADAFTPAELTVLKREAVRLCRGELGEFRGLQSAMADETDEAVIARYLCVHDPHKISEVYRRFMAHPVLVDVLTRIIGANVKCVQSMYFIKSAGKPGQAWHQDEMFIPTRDRSLTATWVAIDDAHRGNGCLRVIPTSHRSGVIWDCRDNSDEGQFGVTVESCEFPYREEEEVVLEVKAGTAVFFSGYLLHRSFRNDMQQGYRQAYANHYM